MKNLSDLRDNEAEASVIASALAHPEYILYTDYLKSEYFYDKFNSAIYSAIISLQKRGITSIDEINIFNEINANPRIKNMCPEDKLDLQFIKSFITMSAIASRPTIGEYKLAVDNVISMAYKRDLFRKSQDISKACFDDNMNKTQLDFYVNKEINQISEQYVVSSEIVQFGEIVDDLWGEILDRRNNDGSYGIPSKFALLNKYCTYEPGELILLKARMKQGKSAFMMNEAIHKMKMDIPTLYIDTEMQDRAFFERMLANITGLTVDVIRRGKYSDSEYEKIKKTIDWIKSRKFVHMYMPQQNLDSVYAINKILKYKMGLQFSIYDYIKSDIGDANQNYNVLGGITDQLKNRIAGELNIAVLAGAQLNRQNAVADSDKLERYCSTSIMWRAKTQEELQRDGLDAGNMAMNVNLNRNGASMADDEYISMTFDGDRMRITQAKQPVVQEHPFDG